MIITNLGSFTATSNLQKELNNGDISEASVSVLDTYLWYSVPTDIRSYREDYTIEDVLTNEDYLYIPVEAKCVNQDEDGTEFEFTQFEVIKKTDLFRTVDLLNLIEREHNLVFLSRLQETLPDTIFLLDCVKQELDDKIKLVTQEYTDNLKYFFSKVI